MKLGSCHTPVGLRGVTCKAAVPSRLFARPQPAPWRARLRCLTPQEQAVSLTEQLTHEEALKGGEQQTVAPTGDVLANGDAAAAVAAAAAASAAQTATGAAAPAPITPGLADVSSSSSSSAGATEAGPLKEAELAEASEDNSLAAELKRVITLAIPISIQNLAGFSLSIIGAMFIGRLGPLTLSASVLANSLYNCTGSSIAIGLSAGMETLCGQANGAGNYQRLGVVLQRGILICWTVCLGVALLWLASHSILLAIGQQPEIAALASRYLTLCIPCLFLSITMECLKRYLQAQKAVLPAMGAAAVATVLSPLVFWWFIVKQGLGLDGAAYGFVCCQGIMLAGILGYTMYRARTMEGQAQQTWGGWSGEAFKGWGEYLSYGAPAAIMICGEWWAYEVVILLAGLLPQAEVALSVMGVCLNINAWFYMLPMGLSSAVNTCISNALGAGDSVAARNIFLGSLIAGCLLQAAICCGVMAAGPHLVKMFCSDATIISGCVALLPLLCMLMFFDGVNSVGSGILRGAGRPTLGAWINALGYWVVGVPLAAALAFAGGLGVDGFMIGVGAGALLQAVIVTALVARWDWGKEVERVRAVMAASGGKPALSYGH